jgi:ectoine hydroxylase-related dioxygenase (phytanoyl-CoA dioxygenase family)
VSLTVAQQAGYERNGYVVLREVLDGAAAAAIAGWVDEVAAWAAEDGPGLHHAELTDAGPALARSEDLVDHHAGLRSLLTQGLVPELAGALLGEPAVLYKEKVNYKQPGGAGFAPHQDAPAYRFVDFHVSCMLPLEPATEASGCLWVADGRPREVLAMDGVRGLSAEVVDALDWHPVELAPGDLLWFDSYVPHHSGPNLTDVPRRALYLTYNAASAGDFRTTYYEDKQATFAGLDDGGDRARLSITDDFRGRPVPG